MSPAGLFLVQVLILIAVPFVIWSIPFVRHTVPLVVIQILFGIALGPTLLARIAPVFASLVLPASSLERLSGISWLAVMFFTFLTGLHLDVGELAGKGRAFFATGVSSMLTPLVFGAGVGLWAISHLRGLMGPNATETTFVLAIGLCVSATALPVLGAILRETGLIRWPLGRLAIGYAALNDFMLWILIIALLTMIGASSNRVGNFIAMILSTLLYVGFMVFCARPLLTTLFDKASVGINGLGDSRIVLISAVVLASGLATEVLGLHYLIGAFVAGLVMPNSAKQSIMAHFEPVTVFVLLPVYFILTGLKVTLDLRSGDVLCFFVIATLAAVGGKILGTAVPARLAGHDWREAIQLGALMQCKGLVEVVILTVLLDAGLISNSAFSALILMALVTTALTMPVARAMGASGANFECRTDADSFVS